MTVEFSPLTSSLTSSLPSSLPSSLTTPLSPPLTPMMAQWKECKDEAKDALLFFRLGDFYEAFHEDAHVIAKELDLTLTERQGVSMCGVPWHTSDTYIDRLVVKGYKIAVAEQMEDPSQTKGLVKRKIVRVASSGTVIHSASIHEKKPNFLVSITEDQGLFGLSLIDISTGKFFVLETKEKRELLSELYKEAPKELLISKKTRDKHHLLFQEASAALNMRLQIEPEWRFDFLYAENALKGHLKTTTLDGFGLKGVYQGVAAAGALITYLQENHVPVTHIQSLLPVSLKDALLLDRQSLVNLEVVETSDDKRATSLFSLIDRCCTAMGSRTLREWLKNPLLDPHAIRERQDAVSALLDDEELKLSLVHIKDLERLATRLKTISGGPRDYVALRHSLRAIPSVKECLLKKESALLKALSHEIHSFEELARVLEMALVDQPPLRASEGGLFRSGYNSLLDELTQLRHSSHEWLMNYQNRLREETGIKTLKVGYTRMFGYYIEISKAQAANAPHSFMRRQTLVNAERFLTQELKEFEDKILSADQKIVELEEELFSALKAQAAIHFDDIIVTSRAIAASDALLSLARVAQSDGYTRPTVDDSNVIEIEAGRHPVIETKVETRREGRHFVPNDFFIDGDKKNLVILTGPNMAGKSTYIRQVALIVILAQMGSFVPAKRCRIGVIDKIFSRIGASDDIARGQSTFMVEMAETASILHQATDRSLVILDEIGRGTSTYDGISIAWAVAEYLVTAAGKRAKTLFATHYYELTDLEKEHVRATNASVAVAESGSEIRFLHKIVPGKTDKSYGIHVAEIAGLPQQVVRRARQLLVELEEKRKTEHPQLELFSKKACVEKRVQETPPPLTTHEKEALQLLRSLNINSITPLESLNTLSEIIKKIS